MSDLVAGFFGLICAVLSLAIPLFLVYRVWWLGGELGRLRAELGGMRAELDGVRRRLDGGTVPAAAREVGGLRESGGGRVAVGGEGSLGGREVGGLAVPGLQAGVSAVPPTDAAGPLAGQDPLRRPGDPEAGSTGDGATSGPGGLGATGSDRPDAIRGAPGAVPPGATAGGPAGPGAVPPPPPPPPSRPIPRPPASGPSLDTLSLDKLALWILSIGAGALFLLASLFGFREAIVAGWVGPAARFGLGVFVGVVAWGLAEVLRGKRYLLPASALLGGGATALFGALYAGHSRYGLLSQPVTFVGMVAITGVTLAAASGLYRSRFAGWLAAVGGYMTPVLLSTGENKAVAFFGYLTLLNVGILYAATKRRWYDLVWGAALMTTVLYVGWAVQWRAPDQVGVGLGAATVLGLLFLAPLFLPPLFSPKGSSLGSFGAGGSLPLFAAGIIFVVPTDPSRYDPRSALTLSWGLGHTAWMAAAYCWLVAGVLALVGAPRDHLGLRWASRPVLMGLGMALVLGWGLAGEPRPEVVAIGAAGMVVAACLAKVRTRDDASWVVLLAAIGASAVIPFLEPASYGWSIGLTLFLGVIGTILGWSGGPRYGLLVTGMATALPLAALTGGGGTAGEEAPMALLFAAAVALYAMAAWPPFLRRVPRGRWETGAGALAGVLYFYPLWVGWVATLGDGYVGLLPVLLGATALLGAMAMVRLGGVTVSSAELAGVATITLGFAAVAVPLQLERAWLTIGWAVEVALLGRLYRRLRHPGIVAFAALLSVLVGARLFLNPDALNYGDGRGMILFNWTLYTWGVPLVAALFAARGFADRPIFSRALSVGAIILGFYLVNLEVAHAFAHDGQLSFSSEDLAQGMTRSVAWGAYGLLLVALGSWRRDASSGSTWTRAFGLFFALLGAGKVCVVDLWSLSGFYRVGSLLGLGVVLILAAIAFQRLILRDRRENP